MVQDNSKRLKSKVTQSLLSLAVVFAGTMGCSAPCDEVDCENGGICVDGLCACPEGWQGETCSEPVQDSSIGCGNVTSVTFDQHVYDVVEMGDQCWFAENLRSDTYRNGDPIPGGLTDEEWASTTSGAQTVYGEGTTDVLEGSADEVENLEKYGRLYNWYAVNDPRGLCPAGWHVPTDLEWKELVDTLGGVTSAGTRMKATSFDEVPWDGLNLSGFTAVPSGGRQASIGYYHGQGSIGYWWTSSVGSLTTWNHFMQSGCSDVFRGPNLLGNGISVRCKRD